MGAHSNFEQALAGVTAFATAVPSDSESEDRRRSRKAKKHKSKQDKKGSKKSVRHKSEEKKRQKKRRRSHNDSDADSSDSEVYTVEAKLELGRAAVRCTREIMSHFPNAKQSLRQMFWRLDNSEAANISGLLDVNLRGLLEVLFGYLQLLKVKEGVYVRRKKGETVLGLLGHVLEEVPAAPSIKPVDVARPQSAEAVEEPHQDPDSAGDTECTQENGAIGTASAENGGGPTQLATGAPAIGPAIPEEIQAQLDNSPDAEEGAGDAGLPDQKSTRRLVGPAMPPQELLDAAAGVAEAMAAEEAEIAAQTMIGPPPPEMVAEADAVPGDARTAEVLRIFKILEGSVREKKTADAYEVVGADLDASANEIKKRYWKLSLMIHPDKCDHPKAQEAFNALSQAAKNLQDAGKRTAIDKEREKAEFDAFTRAELANQETARQWRVARGQGTAEDLQGPAAVDPTTREEWITVLPAARRASAPSQKSQTTFSQQDVAAVGQDASSWSDTPAQKLLRLQQASAGFSIEASAAQARAAKKAEAVDRYNQMHRAKTLVEQHAEQQQKEKKQKKKKQKSTTDGDASQQDQEWVGNHPWRPFDRERDLQTSSKPTNQAEFLTQMGDLTGRFGGSNNSAAPRNFL